MAELFKLFKNAIIENGLYGLQQCATLVHTVQGLQFMLKTLRVIVTC